MKPNVLLTMVIVVLFVAGPVSGLAQPPKPEPLPGNRSPTYPPEARQEGIEGDVVYRAIVSPEGSVTDVIIMSVPQADVGFESAVRATVTRWKFDPAVHEGVPITSTYVSKMSFFNTLPRSQARMYGLKSEAVWRELRQLLKELGIRVDKRDRKNQWLVTKYTSFDNDRLGLASDSQEYESAPERFQLHVFIPAVIEPARVYLGSIVEAPTGRDEKGRRRKAIYYNTGDVEESIFRKLEDRLALSGSAIPVDNERRRTQALELVGAEGHPCLTQALPTEVASSTVTVPPKKLHNVAPRYPGTATLAAKDAVVMAESVLFEDGFVGPKS